MTKYICDFATKECDNAPHIDYDFASGIRRKITMKCQHSVPHELCCTSELTPSIPCNEPGFCMHKNGLVHCIKCED